MSWFMKLGIRKKIQIILLDIFFLCAIICICISVGVSINLQKNSIKETVINAVSDEKNLLVDYFHNIDEISVNLMYSSWLQEPIINGTVRNPSVVNEIQDNISSLSFLYSNIQFVVMTLEGQTVLGGGVTDFEYTYKIEEQSWYEEFLEQKKYLALDEEQPFKDKNKNESVTLFYSFHNYYTLDPLGYLIVRVPMKNIENIVEQHDTQQCHSMLSIGKNKQEWMEKPICWEEPVFIKNSSLCVSSKNIELYGKKLQIYSVYDSENSRFWSQNQTIWFVLLAILLLIGLALLAVSFVLSRYLTSPIIKCRDAMREIQNNNLGITLENRYQDEIGHLIDGFNQMSLSIGDLVESNKRISVLQKDVEFKILERQLTPHFLFNSLELINSLIFIEDYEAAGHITASLGQLYQYNLRSDKWITLREELEYTKNYLEVMSYKIENLEIVFEVEENVLDSRIIKATLQPLVENSIRHGFRGRISENCVTIMANRTEKGIFIGVMDNGCGMNDETCEKLMNELIEIRENPGQKLRESSHVGIKNVFQRLYLEYGESFEFQITSRENIGTRIEIKVSEGGFYV